MASTAELGQTQRRPEELHHIGSVVRKITEEISLPDSNDPLWKSVTERFGNFPANIQKAIYEFESKPHPFTEDNSPGGLPTNVGFKSRADLETTPGFRRDHKSHGKFEPAFGGK